MPLRYLRALTCSSRQPAADRHLGYMLAAVAGATNAIGFAVVREHTSHMTGMASMVGERLSTGEPALALAALGTLGAFVAGAAGCTVVVQVARRRGSDAEFAPPLLLEALLLLAISLWGLEGAGMSWARAWQTTFALAFTMGLQNALITKISRGEIRTTHMTGIVTDLGIEGGRWIGRRLGNPMAGPPSQPANGARSRLLGGLLTSFVLGCAAGSLASNLMGQAAFLVPALPLAVVAMVALAGRRRRSSRPGEDPSPRARGLEDGRRP